MTEINTTVASVSSETVERVQRRVFSGVLSNIETDTNNGTETVLASLTSVYKGNDITLTVLITGDALLAVKDLLVEGEKVRFYGERRSCYVAVIGPDLTKRNLARAEKAAAPVAAPKAKTIKRPMSPAQAAAWAPIQARMNAGLAAKRAAAQAIAA